MCMYVIYMNIYVMCDMWWKYVMCVWYVMSLYVCNVYVCIIYIYLCNVYVCDVYMCKCVCVKCVWECMYM